ncbi:MAG: hypothetical protein ABI317_07305, partial [Gaiellales bacterium]
MPVVIDPWRACKEFQAASGSSSVVVARWRGTRLGAEVLSIVPVLLADLASTSDRISETSSRLAKRDLLA